MPTLPEPPTGCEPREQRIATAKANLEAARRRVEAARVDPLVALILEADRPAPKPEPHGRFGSHIDLPLLDASEAARMEPVWEAIYGLVRDHPDGCGCDPTVMAWRGAYAAAEILLRLPDAEGVFRRRYVGDVEHVYGWRCTSHDHPVVRTSKTLDANSVHKAYEAHMAAKHPEEATHADSSA